MKIVLLGPPGAGKGTQAKLICKDFNIIQLSTGDILRKNINEGTELGIKAQDRMGTGELLPDSLIIEMVKNEILGPNTNNGYLLDGFPRTVPQAEAFEKILQNIGQNLKAVLVLDVPNEELVRRLSARRTCKQCGKTYHLIFNPPKQDGICDLDGAGLYQREDDKEGPILNRLKVYENQTFPLIEYYTNKNLAIKIDGMGNINDIYERIKKELQKL